MKNNSAIVASNSQAFDYFGRSIDIYEDTIVVGAVGKDSGATVVNGNQSDNTLSRAGAAYVFVRDNGMWSQEAYLKTSKTDEFDDFGHVVTIYDNTVVVGAYMESSNAMGINVNQNNNGAQASGAVYIFERNQGAWS